MLLLGCCLIWPADAADDPSTNAALATAKEAESSSSMELLRTVVQLQEQIHATQLSLERDRQEAAAAAIRNAEATEARLKQIEDSLSAQRTRELEAIQSTNRMVLMVAGIFGVAGFLAMLLTSWLQWRSVGKLAEQTASLAGGRALMPGWNAPMLAANDPTHAVDMPGSLSARLLETLGALEKRILSLEHTATPPINLQSASTETATSPDHDSKSPGDDNGSDGQPADDHAALVATMLGKGQSLLNLGKPEEAIECFDSVLAVDQCNTEALVKKGVALERQRKLNEAIDCYDRALATDDSVTIAHLYKGGIYNRLEKFNEALECYEKALRSQEKRRG